MKEESLEQRVRRVKNALPAHVLLVAAAKTRTPVEVETADSLRIAEAVNSRSAAIGKVMPVLIEINSGRESNKSGVSPDEVISLVGHVSARSCLETGLIGDNELNGRGRTWK